MCTFEILPFIGKNRRLRHHTALWSHENTGRKPCYQRNIIFLALLHSSRYSGWLGAKENGEDTNNGRERERDKNSLLKPLFDMNRSWGHVPLVSWSPVPLACTSHGSLRTKGREREGKGKKCNVEKWKKKKKYWKKCKEITEFKREKKMS